MNKLIILCLALYAPMLLAQPEIELRYESNDYIEWNNKLISDQSGPSTFYVNAAPSFGLAYKHFIQPNRERQISYYGAVSYSVTGTPVSYYKISQPAIGLGFRFFPFNMDGDCDCPSFYQEGNVFSRGFNLSVGANYGFLILQDQPGQSQALFDFQAGLRIPIAKIFAIQPFLGFTFGTRVHHMSLDDNPGSTLNQIKIGLQISPEISKKRSHK